MDTDQTIELVGGPCDGVRLTLPPMVGEFRINWIVPETEASPQQEFVLIYRWDGHLIEWVRKRFMFVAKEPMQTEYYSV